MNSLEKIIIVKNWLNFISSYFTTQARLLEMVGNKDAQRREEWYEFMASLIKTAVYFFEVITSHYQIISGESNSESQSSTNASERTV